MTTPPALTETGPIVVEPAGRTSAVFRTRFVIGSGLAADLRLDGCAPQHAVVWPDAGTWWVSDFGQGTFVTPGHGPAIEVNVIGAVALGKGDRLRCGSAIMTVVPS